MCVFQNESLQRENIAFRKCAMVCNSLAAENEKNNRKVLRMGLEIECQCQMCHTHTHNIFAVQALHLKTFFQRIDVNSTHFIPN